MRRYPILMVMTCWFFACSDMRLEFPDEEVEVEVVDNELSISGQFCTSEAGNVEYPVKVMFVVDGSGSQQFSDQNRQRVVAVEETINALIGLGNTYFKVIVFNASVTATPGVPSNLTTCNTPVFTADTSVLTNALNNLAEADSLTDYQGALSVAYAELKRDMGCQTQAELGRTKYVVIFVSDGMPDPQCTIGLGNDFDPVNVTEPYLICENSNYVNCILQRDGTECSSSRYGTCSNGAPGCAYLDQIPYCCDTSYDGGSPQELFGGLAGGSELEGGNDYNQPYQILQKVENIMELQDQYEVGQLRVHAGLVLDPLADPAVIEIFGDAAQAAPLMQQVAEIGTGKYMEFYGGDSIDFLQINFQSIKQQRVIRGFFADNLSARMTVVGLEADSDNDGLTDREEEETHTDPRNADTDGDGYRDLVEVRQLGFSFDPLDPCKPPIDDTLGLYRTRTDTCDGRQVNDWDNVRPAGLPLIVSCAHYNSGDCSGGSCSISGFADRDRDGLHDCEERAIGTDPDHPDTDKDGMLDLQEFVYGLDPSDWDFDQDDDKDTVPNGRELEWHLNPVIQQSEEGIRDRYRYSRPLTGTTIDGRSCFEFSVRRLQLEYTKENIELQDIGLAGVGFNEIRLYILENMADNLSGAPLVRTACVRGQYIPPSKKVPVTGQVNLTEDQFWYLQSNDDIRFQDPAVMFDPNTHCTLLTD